MNFMRLSSMKAAHVAVGWCCVQEIRVSRTFFARCGRRRPRPATFEGLKDGRSAAVYPTSREKRARYGAPFDWRSGQNSRPGKRIPFTGLCNRGIGLKIFLTGATGFVGSHVAQELSRRGAQLRILIRSTSKLENLAGLAAETVLGDLLRVDALRSAIAGCDAVMHVAADYRLWVTDPKTMFATNVTGTRGLLRVAREEGVRRVVYPSIVATIGFLSNGCPADEAPPVCLDDMIGDYKRSKYQAQEEAVTAPRAGQLVIILNPTPPIGSNDT